MDINNKFLVSSAGSHIAILNSRNVMTADEAIVFAAWLVCVAMPDATITFEDALEAIRNT